MKRSKPSVPPSHRSGRKRSTTSWTIPEPADVISYSYLWAREAAEGQEEGLKDRPVVVMVVARIDVLGRTQLLVAPITHVEPQRSDEGVELPLSVKKHLGLDRERSWIVLTELNRFYWPGPDIRLAPGSQSPLYEALPEWLFRKVQQSIAGKAKSGTVEITRRTE